ncbi:uncharacterized protein LOC134458629 [Engraulis encrasicolus]|uniref:uncharacterized protein LOC134458629 n=1 Tax=Engraulis encrasicolus TaxID=184585 RepID=UPI002FD193EF
MDVQAGRQPGPAHLDMDVHAGSRQPAHQDMDVQAGRRPEHHLDMDVQAGRQQPAHLDMDVQAGRQQPAHQDRDVQAGRQPAPVHLDMVVHAGRLQPVHQDMDVPDVPMHLLQSLSIRPELYGAFERAFRTYLELYGSGNPENVSSCPGIAPFDGHIVGNSSSYDDIEIGERRRSSTAHQKRQDKKIRELEREVAFLKAKEKARQAKKDLKRRTQMERFRVESEQRQTQVEQMRAEIERQERMQEMQRKRMEIDLLGMKVAMSMVDQRGTAEEVERLRAELDKKREEMRRLGERAMAGGGGGGAVHDTQVACPDEHGHPRDRDEDQPYRETRRRT